MSLDYKANPLSSLEIKQADSGWEVAGYASTFGGDPDLGGDVVERGAFADSLQARKTKLLYNHDAPIGSELSLAEDSKGLFGRWSIIDTTVGADAHKLAKAGVLDALSIGYRVRDAGFDEVDGQMIRRIKAADVYEVSLVALPMNERALITRVKHALNCAEGDEDKAEWSAAFINDLPDAAFAYIEPGGDKDADGKTVPRSKRHFPHHGTGGGIDLPHLRNALSRAPQSPFGDKAMPHLRRHASSEGVGKAGLDLDELPFGEKLAVLEHYLLWGADEAEALAHRRADEGRKLSEAHIDAIDGLLGHVKAATERLDALLRDAAAEAKAPTTTSEAARRLALFDRAQARRDRQARYAALGILE